MTEEDPQIHVMEIENPEDIVNAMFYLLRQFTGGEGLKVACSLLGAVLHTVPLKHREAVTDAAFRLTRTLAEHGTDGIYVAPSRAGQTTH